MSNHWDSVLEQGEGGAMRKGVSDDNKGQASRCLAIGKLWRSTGQFSSFSLMHLHESRVGVSRGVGAHVLSLPIPQRLRLSFFLVYFVRLAFRQNSAEWQELIERKTDGELGLELKFMARTPYRE